MEMVDVVDENDSVIGQIAKEEAHNLGLLHRTIIAEVIDSAGNWLLVKQAPHKQDSQQYVSPMGGHMEAGETEIEALKREAEEELGFKNFKYKLKGKVIFNRPVQNHIENHYFIVYEIYSDKKPVLNAESVKFMRISSQNLKKQLKEKPERFGAAFHYLVKHLYPELYS